MLIKNVFLLAYGEISAFTLWNQLESWNVCIFKTFLFKCKGKCRDA